MESLAMSPWVAAVKSLRGLLLPDLGEMTVHKPFGDAAQAESVRRLRWDRCRSFPLRLLSPSIPTSAEKSHRLNSGASLATILNESWPSESGMLFSIFIVSSNKATQQIDQRAFIVVQTGFFRRPRHFLAPHFWFLI
jgi:hypothetical protein